MELSREEVVFAILYIFFVFLIYVLAETVFGVKIPIDVIAELSDSRFLQLNLTNNGTRPIL